MATQSTLLELDAEVESHLALRDPPRHAEQDDQATRLRRLVQLTATQPGIVPGPVRRQPLQTPARTALAKVIAVASGKGGVGKTNFSVNLAVVLAQRGLRVILVDADLGTANADVLCGLMPSARLNHVVTALPVHDGARRSASEILIDAPGGFRLLPGSAGVARMADFSLSQQHRLLEIVGELERDADVLILDTAAGVGRSVTSLVEAADMGIVITTPEPTAIADAYALIKCVVLSENGNWNAEHAARLRLVVNQTDSSEEAVAVHARLNAVCERFLGVRAESIGEVAQDLRVAQSVRARRPFVLNAPDCAAARHMGAVGDRIIHQLGLRRHDAPAEAGRGFRATLARVLRGG